MGSLKAIESLGINVKSEKDIVEEHKKEEVEQGDDKKVDKTEPKPPVINIRGGAEEIAVREGLIPPAYKEAEFDEKKIRENIVAQAKEARRRFLVKNFDDYIAVLSEILTSIRSGVMLNKSYLIGAPNGFGKTSFVNTAIKVMVERDWRAVPYISLHELAELRIENEKRLIAGMELGEVDNEEEEPYYYYKDPGSYVKLPQVITGKYSWSEYMNADILFCFFSTIDSKVIESHTLKCVLDIRAAKGLPTVAFISTSINPYMMDRRLRAFVWDEILAYKEDKNCFDRVHHTSCYKVENNIISGNDDIGI